MSYPHMFQRYAICLLVFSGCGLESSTSTSELPFDAWSPERIEAKATWIETSAIREKRANTLQEYAKNLLCSSSGEGGVNLDTQRLSPQVIHNFTDLLSSTQTESLGWLTMDTVVPPSERRTSGSTFTVAFEDYFSSFSTVDICDLHTYSFTESDLHSNIKISWHLSGRNHEGRPMEEHSKFTVRFTKADDVLDQLSLIQNYRVTGSKPLFRDMSKALLEGTPTDPKHTRPINDASGGLSVHDVNDDGLLDIYIAQDGPNLLYIQQQNGRYVESAESYGIADISNGRGVVFADFDDDGLDDLVIANSEFGDFKGEGSNEMYRRVSPERFERATPKAFGSVEQDSFTHVSVADIDGDEDLDIFIGCYGGRGVEHPNHYVNADNGCLNQLWINQGGFKFSQESKQRGLTHTDWTYAAGFVDIDLDNDQDLYVANDWGKNRFYLNDGSGVFRDIAPQNDSAHPGAGMGVLWADLDQNGAFDLYIANMYSNAGNRIMPYSGLQGAAVKDALLAAAAGNELYLNPSTEKSTVATHEYGMADGGWAWGAVAFDYDLDGDLDIYQANGFITGKRLKDQ